MLSKEENELLTRVGPGTPMGELLRQYWQPVLLTSELPERDGRPLRVRLLGEDLVAFRDSAGRVGLLADHCSHRGASLFFGRNEEHGLRCVYHGWKYDVAGRCMEMPNEPGTVGAQGLAPPQDRIRQRAYPCVERNGVVWTYMGPLAELPGLPELEWNLVPERQCYLTKRVQECNWVQAMEGEIDSSHASFLHTRLDPDEDDQWAREQGGSRGMLYKMRDKHPHFETVDTAYGVVIGARRKAEEDSYYWRITQFLMPFHTLIPPYGDDPSFSGHAWVPVDDGQTLCLCFSYHPTKAVSERQFNTLGFSEIGLEGLHPSPNVFLPATSDAHGAWIPKITRSNDFLPDWEAQVKERFSGLPGVWPADAACQVSMGSIYDRSQERLGSSDSGIIRVRQRLINAARALHDAGTTPVGAGDPRVYQIRSAAVVLPRNEPWLDAAKERLTATPGVNYPAA